jgi:hypothetical protein
VKWRHFTAAIELETHTMKVLPKFFKERDGRKGPPAETKLWGIPHTQSKARRDNVNRS